MNIRELANVEFFYDIPHPTVTKGNTFKHYTLSPVGIGRNGTKIVALDRFIRKALFYNIQQELETNVPLFKDHWVSMIPKGIVPAYLNGEPSLDCFMENKVWLSVLEEEIKDLKSLIRIREYVYNAMKLTKGWRATLQLRETTNFKNKTLPSKWKPIAQRFPYLVEFVQNLPLKSIGYVNVMMYEKGRALQIHRDTFLQPHTEHFINVNFHTKSKPFFIYDEENSRKTYLPKGAQCYFFNECDLHGVDATEEDYYTVRIDCQFEDWFAELLDMENGYVFKYDYVPEYKRNTPIKVWSI